MTRVNLLVCIAVSLLVLSLWAYFNRPEIEPPWPERIQGFSFSPLRAGDNPITHKEPTEEEIDSDLGLLAGRTNAIRTYSVDGVLGRIPELAKRHGLNVTLGAWLDQDLETNEEQIAEVIRLAKKNYRNVIRVVVGNEALLRGDLSIPQLTAYVDRVREALDIPVSTAEPWHIWYKHPELGSHVDFIAAHMLPYWEGTHVKAAVGQVVGHHNLLSKTFPDKQVVIAEVGWPSLGRTRGDAAASLANQATFLRRFLEIAEEKEFIYYVMEAFDQPWKRYAGEGAVGGYWGVYDVERQPKFPFNSPIVGIPEWQMLAGISIAIAAVIFMLLVIDSKTLALRGRGFLASIAFMMATGAVWIVYSYSRQYLSISTVAIGLLMVVGLIGVVIVVLAEAHEWAEALWGDVGRRSADVEEGSQPLPFVSIHVPAYNEPPDMMIDTLNGLAALDYPHFEVIVIDNNTKDPEVWQPVEAHCRSLGERFRFFHEGSLAGFKAGALNYALARTAAEAEVVAVIDSDYLVSPNWLRDLIPLFDRNKVAIVQAPQDYRDAGQSLFKAMCFAEYRGFFRIGMVIRNERNAIIQHGTMTMVRRRVLEEVEGWAEWCITEDAELGLRIFAKGYEALYVPQSYGRGLMPDTFVDFKKQRYRWAYGAVQIMRHHFRSLVGRYRPGGLTTGQRYHFVAGWLPWIADSINLVFTLSALGWTTAMILAPRKFDPPMLIFSMVPLAFFIFKLAKMFYLYRNRVSGSMAHTLSSAVAGLSLTHTIAKAVLYGFVTSTLPFFRTPKQAGGSSFWYAIQGAREEMLMAFALLLSATIVSRNELSAGPDLLVWMVVLIVQSIPYLASVAMSFIAAWAQLRARRGGPGVTRSEGEIEAESVADNPQAGTSGDDKGAPASLKGLLWLALPCLTPALLRLLDTGLTEPAGLLSDTACGLALLALMLWLSRWLRVALAIGWALFHLMSHELLLAVHRPPTWQDFIYLLDPQFLANTTAGLHLSAPFYGLALLVALVPAFFSYRSARMGMPLAVLAASLLLLAVHNPVVAKISGNTYERYNPAHWLAVQAVGRLGQEGDKDTPVALPPGFIGHDLKGERLLPQQQPSNVLIVAMEGVSWFYLAKLLDYPVPADTHYMEGLAGQLKGAMLVPDFTVHSHQTIRGLYALHCGDFSKLSSDTPKAFELQLNPDRAAQCLPARLNANGWQSHFLQGAPLQFMNKDQAMPMMGFEQVHGRKWFGNTAKTDFIWGPGDEEFFQGARRYINGLRENDKPWVLSLLTVGTHQPFSASEQLVRKYGSRKRAAVAELDQAVAGFLTWLKREGVLKNTLVIVTSDESHGGAGADWHSSWGFCAVLAPDGKSLPRKKAGSYGLVDIETSVLDYFGLEVPPSVLGRSLFRDYASGRDMISNTAGKLRYQHAAGLLEECGSDGICASFPDGALIGPRQGTGQPVDRSSAEKLTRLSRQLDRSVSGTAKTRVLQFGNGEIRHLPEKINNEWTDNLVGAQYLAFPEGSTVSVDIGVTAVAAPKGLDLRLIMRQFEQPAKGIVAPAFPKIATGESANVSFSFRNEAARKAFSFHLIGEGLDGQLRIDRFQVSVTR